MSAARTVLHGTDQSVEDWSKLANIGGINIGHRVWVEREGYSVVYEHANKILVPDGRANALYDFAKHGGAIGAINIGILPPNFVIERAYVNVLTTLTSATDAATVALSVEAADDIVAAVAISDGANPWDAGHKAGIPDGAVANFVKSTVERNIVATIAGEAVTAGKFQLSLLGRWAG